MSLLSIKNASTGYGKRQVLFDVSLDIEKGDTVLLVGSNGSGKSTLLKMVYGLLDVWEGSVEYNGVLLHDAKLKTPTHTLIDKGIQYVPQKDELFDDATVLENLQFSLLHLKDRKESARRIAEVMEDLPLLKDRRKQPAGRLSGGERKMLALGMVMANKPSLLLYDEPLAGLSEEKIPETLSLLAKIRDHGTTMVIVEHHIKEMLGFTRSVVGMHLGHIRTAPFESAKDIQRFLVNYQ